MKSKAFIFAKLGVALRNHDKMLAAVDEVGWGAVGVYTWATMDLRDKESNDGVIPASTLRLALGRQRDTMKIVAALVKVGLFVERGDGFYVDKYEQFNDTRDVIESARAKDRQRKRAPEESGEIPFGIQSESERKDTVFPASVSASVSDSVFGSDLPEEGSGETNSVQAYQRAYEAGIREGLGNGGGYAMPENQRGALHQAILAHSEKRKGENLLKWISAAAADFSEDIKRRPDEAKFYSAFGPRGMLKWLNEQAAHVEAKAAP